MRYLEFNPLATGEDLDLRDRMDFPESAPRLADLIGMLGIKHGSATQVMLAIRFHATVGQKQTQKLGGQQQPWLSETRVQSVDRIGTREMTIPAMANRIINVKRASDSLWLLPKLVSLQTSNGV
jgi:hypothetical protein